VIALTLRVETPCTCIFRQGGAREVTSVFSEREWRSKSPFERASAHKSGHDRLKQEAENDLLFARAWWA
jgi:hypothetical protein